MARNAQKKDHDYDDFLDGACDPIIAGDIQSGDDGFWRAYIYAHSNTSARCIGTGSTIKAVVDEERARMIFELMQRGANVIVCNCAGDMGAALKKWPQNVIDGLIEDDKRRKRALS